MGNKQYTVIIWKKAVPSNAPYLTEVILRKEGATLLKHIEATAASGKVNGEPIQAKRNYDLEWVEHWKIVQITLKDIIAQFYNISIIQSITNQIIQGINYKEYYNVHLNFLSRLEKTLNNERDSYLNGEAILKICYLLPSRRKQLLAAFRQAQQQKKNSGAEIITQLEQQGFSAADFYFIAHCLKNSPTLSWNTSALSAVFMPYLAFTDHAREHFQTLFFQDKLSGRIPLNENENKNSTQENLILNQHQLARGDQGYPTTEGTLAKKNLVKLYQNNKTRPNTARFFIELARMEGITDLESAQIPCNLSRLY